MKTIQPAPASEIVNNFIRGAVATGLLTAIQNRPACGKTVLKRALQGGSAMAAGVTAANALQARAYGTAALAVLGGALGIAAAEYIDRNIYCKELEHEQEETQEGL